MKKFFVLIMFVFLAFAVGCDFSNIKPDEEKAKKLGNECDSAIIKTSDDEFTVNKDTNPLDLINFIKKYVVNYSSVYNDHSLHVEGSIKSNSEEYYDIQSEMDLVQYLDPNIDAKVYCAINTKVNGINLYNELLAFYENFGVNRASIYKNNDKLVAGSRWYTEKEMIKDLPEEPTNDEYANYYSLFYYYINKYDLGLLPRVIRENKAVINNVEYQYNQRYEITIYDNYILLKVIDDLGIIDVETPNSTIYPDSNCIGETFIYINNNTGVIDKVIYQGKAVDKYYGYMDYDITVLRTECSYKEVDTKKAKFDEYFDSVK